jgi:hypothetical protein
MEMPLSPAFSRRRFSCARGRLPPPGCALQIAQGLIIGSFSMAVCHPPWIVYVLEGFGDIIATRVSPLEQGR